ncbi:MAG: crossover junction endodeoxyribonuclease RuvC [Acidobacteria bacterium]|nr:MAG: crossover junction endodeoxyribonuclease RuvC [Acidobacteriota bacterium]REK03977.1 MAG: crossover junction endodeoxyribonuclease RuvC [Acidobacteriota bacterium]REK15139.1 MAG: crossover junction endodeoxyribonuclease RuvC [Acidobacteriota bacterium]REK46229.1 MAG: crossover junction endodeoxyribonuclease RuvC [Acidobacteriota bacterium]
MRVLGIDPGSEVLGWGILDGGPLKYRGVAYGVIKPGRRAAFPKRLSTIHNDLLEVIEKYQPDILAIEEAFFAKNAKVAIKLGQVRGVVLLVGESSGLEIVEYSPRLIKQTIVGYGNAEKLQVQEMVRVLLKLEKIPEPHDAADALATGICHFHHCTP